MSFKVLFILPIFFVLSFWIFSFIKFPAFASAKFSKVNDSKSVPEMVDILGSDQETRLLGGRRLVERVGVESALEILEHSVLPHTGEGHLVVHQIGFYAYKTYGTESILKCKDYFLYACYHGAIIEAASDQGTEQIARMTDKCKESGSRYFQCVHAAGHAILAMWNYELPSALKTCDDLYEKEAKFPEALGSCHNGAFMENLFGVHDWGTSEEVKRDWISEDPYFPCNAFEEKYQKGCWLNQAARIYQMYGNSVEATVQACAQVANFTYSEWCFDNLSRQIHALTDGKVQKVFELCSYLGYWRAEKCVNVNAGSFFSVGDAKTAIEVCSKNTPYFASLCFENIFAQASEVLLSAAEKGRVCLQSGAHSRRCHEVLKV